MSCKEDVCDRIPLEKLVTGLSLASRERSHGREMNGDGIESRARLPETNSLLSSVEV